MSEATEEPCWTCGHGFAWHTRGAPGNQYWKTGCTVLGPKVHYCTCTCYISHAAAEVLELERDRVPKPTVR